MKNAIFQYFVPDNGVGKLKHYKGVNKIPEWGEYSVAYMKRYADTHDADYFFFEDRYVNSQSNYFEICRIFLDPVFDQYDKVMYADVDVMVKDMSQNVFDQPTGDVAGWPEHNHHLLNAQINWGATPPLRERFQHFGAQLIPPKTVPNPIRMLNTGVLVWSREARLRAREEFANHDEWFNYKNAWLDKKWTNIGGHSSHCLDQPYLNAMFNKCKFRVAELEMKWNRFPTFDENWPCVFAHYVGEHRYKIPERFKDIR